MFVCGPLHFFMGTAIVFIFFRSVAAPALINPDFPLTLCPPTLASLPWTEMRTDCAV